MSGTLSVESAKKVLLGLGWNDWQVNSRHWKPDELIEMAERELEADPEVERPRSSANGTKGAHASESAAAPVGMPWQTAAAIAAATPVEIDWLWQDYLALNTVVELDAKIKTGKSTLVGNIVRSVVTGADLLGRAVLRGPVVYLTEEGNRTFRSMLARCGLDGREDVHVLSKRHVASLPWEQLVAAAAAKVKELGAPLLVVDTLGKLANFKDDDENSAGKASAAMNPLQALASSLPVVVLVTRHDRKSGGDPGDSARGSSQLGGDVDVILQLSRVGGKGRERRRYLRAVGRFDETPEEVTIELTPHGYQEVTEADGCERAVAAVRELLPDEEAEAICVPEELLPTLKEAGHSRTYVYQALNQLEAEGELASAKRPTEELDAKGRPRTKRFVWRTVSNGGT